VGWFFGKDEKPIDEVVATFFKSPASYTGEDVVEISCHGSPLIAGMIVEACVARGAKMARPGEFTLRAVLNGKIDLLQAEAIRDLIESRTRYQLELALRQREGRLSGEVGQLREELVDVVCHLETALEFGEEDVVPADRKALSGRIGRAISQLETWVASYALGRTVREGLKVVLTGRQNAGKSSIFNKLVKSERAIVTSIPGTTRDSLHEWLDLAGTLICLVDTAGFIDGAGRWRSEGFDGSPGDSEFEELPGGGVGGGEADERTFLDRKGAERSLRELRDADVVVLVVDRSRGFGGEDRCIWEAVRGKRVIVVVNKDDLGGEALLADEVREGAAAIVRMSARTGDGLGALAEAVRSVAAVEDGMGRESSVITDLRQKECMERTREKLIEAVAGLEAGLSEEYVSFDIRNALEALGEMTGETRNEEILSRVFSTFCIGK